MIADHEPSEQLSLICTGRGRHRARSLRWAFLWEGDRLRLRPDAPHPDARRRDAEDLVQAEAGRPDVIEFKCPACPATKRSPWADLSRIAHDLRTAGYTKFDVSLLP